MSVHEASASGGGENVVEAYVHQWPEVVKQRSESERVREKEGERERERERTSVEAQ